MAGEPSPQLQSMEVAFKRHPRPQAATVPRLPLMAIKHPADNEMSTQLSARKTNPWKTYLRLGQLVQSAGKYDICSKDGRVFMMQKDDIRGGNAIVAMLHNISHPNIAVIRDFLEFEGSSFLCYDYYRYTLTEVLAISLRLQEPQLQCIAHSVWRIFAPLHCILTVI